MASHRIGETATGLSNAGPSTHHLSFLETNAPPGLIINQDGPSFEFGELEEAIVLQGIKFRDDDVKPTFVAGGGRPSATLEMFPSWPMRYQQTPRGSSKSGGESTDDSGSAVNNNSNSNSISLPSKAYHQNEQPETPVSKLASNSRETHHQLPLQQQQQMASDTSRSSGPSQIHQPKPTQENKKKEAGRSTSDKQLDAKTSRRLAQNREAARKSRLRKKAYVQQLESSRIKLTQLEQELQRARSQGIFLGGGYGGVDGNISSGAAIFDMDYTRWLEDDQRHISELRHCLQSHLSDGDLRMIVDGYVSHYDEIFRLKAAAAKSDVFHLLTGMWASPVERCFLWMGGFRPSDLIKMLTTQLDPWTEQQLMGVYSLQQSSQQAEEALSQGLEQLHQSLIDTVAGGGPIVDGMQQMAIALGKLANLEGFVCQADNLRQQTLHQLRRILTIRQAARCFLVIGEFHNRLRALSSLWASRPREAMFNEDNSGQTATNLQVVQATQNHFLQFD